MKFTKKQEAIARKLKEAELKALEQCFADHSRYYGKAISSKNKTYVEERNGKAIVYSASDEKKKLERLSSEIKELIPMEYSEFFRTYPQHAQKLTEEYRGEIFLERSNLPKVSYLLIIFTAVFLVQYVTLLNVTTYIGILLCITVFYFKFINVPPKQLAYAKA